jgi:hypothetical protein
VRHGQDPLAQWDGRHHAIDEAGREIGHAAADTARAEAAPLTRKRDGAAPAAVAAPCQDEAMRQDPAAEEGLDLGRDEGGKRRLGGRLQVGQEGLPLSL